MQRAEACTPPRPVRMGLRRVRAREGGQESLGVSPKAKRPLPVPEVNDPDMSNDNMSVTELTQALCQLQAQQAAVELWMQAMTSAVDDHASSLEGAAKEILGIHGAHTLSSALSYRRALSWLKLSVRRQWQSRAAILLECKPLTPPLPPPCKHGLTSLNRTSGHCASTWQAMRTLLRLRYLFGIRARIK